MERGRARKPKFKRLRWFDSSSPHMLIFLDIDGVMVPMKNWLQTTKFEDGFPRFSEEATTALLSLINDETRVILTTSHKSRFSLQEWKEIFKRRGIWIEKLDTLDENVESLSRKEEILNWFDIYWQGEKFLIIDDDKGLNDLPTALKDRLISTSSMIGLTKNNLGSVA